MIGNLVDFLLSIATNKIAKSSEIKTKACRALLDLHSAMVECHESYIAWQSYLGGDRFREIQKANKTKLTFWIKSPRLEDHKEFVHWQKRVERLNDVFLDVQEKLAISSPDIRDAVEGYLSTETSSRHYNARQIQDDMSKKILSLANPMKTLRTLNSILALALVFGCSAEDREIRASITSRGLIAGFPKGLTHSNGVDLVDFEASALAFDGKNLIIGSDKPIPNSDNIIRSSVYSVSYSKFSTDSANYYTNPTFIEAIKYEDFTVTPDGKYVIATTGFDRVDDDGTSKWDNYNTLMYWPVGEPSMVKLFSRSTSDGVTSSVGLRSKISAVLPTPSHPDGVPYFKVEGLAAIPGNKLLFGIRALGKKYNDFDFAIIIISASYTIDKNEIKLADDFEKIFEFDVDAVNPCLTPKPALSSIEYDQFNDRLYLLTSYELDEGGQPLRDIDVGAFLWTIPMGKQTSDMEPELVMLETPSGPLHFAHKAEGLAVISDTRIVVIHDDDRILGRANVEHETTQFSREPHEAAYTVVDFIKPGH